MNVANKKQGKMKFVFSQHIALNKFRLEYLDLMKGDDEIVARTYFSQTQGDETSFLMFL